MPIVEKVDVRFSIGGDVQVKKFDIRSSYHYTAGLNFALEEGDDPGAVIDKGFEQLKATLEPRAQQDFEDLWAQRIAQGE